MNTRNTGRKRRNRAGRAVMQVVLLLLLVATVAGLFLLLSVKTSDRQACEENLKKIYRALELYELERGTLPTLAYFPDDPQADSDSLRIVLESYGADTHACVCPALHPALRDLALTYIWNVRLNGTRLPRGGQPRWMLVEMTAVNTELPKPHLGRYNVLFSDGTVKRVANPWKDLPGL